MKTPRLLTIIFMISCFNISASSAAEHHSGHGATNSGGGGVSESACAKPQLTKFLPANLATVAPGSAFSFLAFNVGKPEQIEVTVKTIPVEVTTEDKDSFYLVKGHLPADLVNTIARINIKVNSKITRCDGESGWLVKIADQ
jgi:hypothetical protein